MGDSAAQGAVGKHSERKKFDDYKISSCLSPGEDKHEEQLHERSKLVVLWEGD